MIKNSPLNGKNVLVVDDDDDLRQAIAFDFKRRGCQVFEAASGHEAAVIVQSTPIHFVISDVRMPNGTGIDLVREIRKSHTTIPIVLLATGFADLTESEALKLGANALMHKPIDRKKMLSLLEKSCELIPDAT